jgi:hypothetical protein
MSYGDFPALLVEEDFRCPYRHYFRHKGTSKAGNSPYDLCNVGET